MIAVVEHSKIVKQGKNRIYVLRFNSTLDTYLISSNLTMESKINLIKITADHKTLVSADSDGLVRIHHLT